MVGPVPVPCYLPRVVSLRDRHARQTADDADGSVAWDLPTAVGRTTLRNPVMPASGTFGYGLEHQAYGDPVLLGALVVKSLSAMPWEGNPPPRLRPLSAGSMLNSIGLPNPGVEAWASQTLPALLDRDVRVVASIWGHTPGELLDAAQLMAKVAGPIAWEVNMSCPNLATSDELPSHNPDVAHEVCAKVRTLADDAVGVWAKLSPHAPDVPAVAAACHDAGVDAVTLTNTFPARAYPSDEPLPRLGGNGGGISGAALKPIVTEIVAAVRRRCPDLAVVAAGGVFTVDDALDYLGLGARAVQVGTANFLDPRTTHRIAQAVIRRLA
jgi:dihydroorotate dehydrogenase (NAD+) catalytic subunit